MSARYGFMDLDGLLSQYEGRIHELEEALGDTLAWIVNGWEWDQRHYDELDAIRTGHIEGTSSPQPPSGGES